MNQSQPQRGHGRAVRGAGARASAETDLELGFVVRERPLTVCLAGIQSSVVRLAVDVVELDFDLDVDQHRSGAEIAGQAAGFQRRGGIGGPPGEEPWRRPVRWQGERPPMIPMGTTGTPTDIGHCIAWLCSDYARLITGCDFVIDGGARAKNWAHVPPEPGTMLGPAPLIKLDITGEIA